jgi:hypothetical protein
MLIEKKGSSRASTLRMTLTFNWPELKDPPVCRQALIIDRLKT